MRRKITTCRSCMAEVFWVRTRSGKNMLLDVMPDDTADFYLAEGEDGKLEGHHRKGYPGKMPDDLELYTSHFATCPNAGQHRR